MIIKVSAQEIKAGLPIEDRWYPGTIKFLSAKANKDSTGIDKIVEITIDDKSPEGRDVKQTLNATFRPSAALWANLIAAADGKNFDKNKVEELEIDTDHYVGKKVNVKVVNDLFNGNKIPKFAAFLPISVDIESVPF